DLRRAKTLARGSTRGGKATFYVPDFPQPLALAQLVKRQLQAIGLDVTLKPIPGSAFVPRISDPSEPWDLMVTLWLPDFFHPNSYINELFDSRFIGSGGNFGRFSSATYDRLMRRAARL